ncbi:cytochrome P450 [Thozetella sp. PMI_491]|nr:cytochrome P450 [Thozetella sp. PMI_491]
MAILSVLTIFTESGLRTATILPLLVLATALALTWAFTTWSAKRSLAVPAAATGGQRRPPMMPSFVPYIGHGLQFAWNAPKFMSQVSNAFGKGTPVRIMLANVSNCVISGPESVVAFFRESRDLSYSRRNVALMSNLFGCPRHLLHHFESGAANLPGGEDLDHLIHISINTGLTGADLDVVTGYFQEYYVQHLSEAAAQLPDDWVDHPDIVSMVENHVFQAAVYAFFGPHMLDLNPNLAKDYADFNRHIRPLLFGSPRWLSPAAHRARDNMVDSIIRWQRYASTQVRPEDVSRNETWEPFWGSRVVRERLLLLTRRGILDERARAAEIFAIMWAFNANSVTASVWLLLESLQNTTWTTKVRERIRAAQFHSTATRTAAGNPDFDLKALMSDDFLQSMYAETLRIRFSALILRQPTTENFSFRGWHVEKDETITLSTYNQATDKQVWSTGGPGDPHPLTTFWADRFMVDPENPLSGPLRNPKQRYTGKASSRNPYFSMDGLATSWIPYGGGRNHCPGRYFAKREMMLTLALFHTNFDIKLKSKPEMDLSLFGFGSMPVKGKVPCRIRRCQSSVTEKM